MPTITRSHRSLTITREKERGMTRVSRGEGSTKILSEWRLQLFCIFRICGIARLYRLARIYSYSHGYDVAKKKTI